jgi:glycosyltransferase involved in cell wall biosynthesis
MADLYATMSVSVLCSKSEGLPNVILESMAAGVPVVGARVGGIPEIVDHEETGLLVDSRKPERFAEAVDALLKDPQKRSEMAAKGRKRVRESFSIEAMAKKYRALYNELLVRSAGGGG